MDTNLDLPRMVARLQDDQLYSLFEDADAGQDAELARAAQDEISRRTGGAAPVTHNVPRWLALLLPRAMWHQKPEGEGRG